MLSYDIKAFNEDFDTAGLIVNGTVSFDVEGATDESTKITASGKADVSFEMQALPETAFNGGSGNIIAKGDSTLTPGPNDGPVIDAYAAVSCNAGFSLDEIPEYSKGGKFIVSFEFMQDVNLSDYDQIEDIADNLKLELLVTAYDNENKRIGEYTFTYDEIVNALD